MIVYKLTDENLQTRNGFQYELGVEARATGDGTRLCSDGVLHVYESLEQAALMSPLHMVARYTVALQCEGEPVSRDWGKFGCKSLTPIRVVDRIKLTTEQRVAVAILAVKDCSVPIQWCQWAYSWLNNTDRSADSAYTAAREASRAESWAAVIAAETAADAVTVSVLGLRLSDGWCARRAAEAVVMAKVVNITSVVRDVLDTPESKWSGLFRLS